MGFDTISPQNITEPKLYQILNQKVEPKGWTKRLNQNNAKNGQILDATYTSI